MLVGGVSNWNGRAISLFFLELLTFFSAESPEC